MARAAPKSISGANNSDDLAVDQQSTSALKAAKRNLAYLYDPKNSPNPTRFRTRALLRSLRYITIWAFWRLVRWAKYIAIGSLVAAVSATAIGGAVTGVGWIAAPPTIGASIISMVVWQAGKFGARRLNKRFKAEGEEDGGVKARQERALEPGMQAVPW